jgi:hypothetical protein
MKTTEQEDLLISRDVMRREAAKHGERAVALQHELARLRLELSLDEHNAELKQAVVELEEAAESAMVDLYIMYDIVNDIEMLLGIA